jgi:(+)-trans-carveol dehydrogenase
MSGRVQGKVAFITGAARGQGRSHALRLAAEGADIIALDICEQIQGVPYEMATDDDLAETVRGVEALGRHIVARKADVRNFHELSAVVAEGLSAFGRLDIVCANAGITGPFGVEESAAERPNSFSRVLDVNLTGAFITVEASKQALIDTGSGGSIILISSLAGLRAIGGSTGYIESKHGLVGMMRSYAHELAPHMIRVNSIHPTNVNTLMIINEPFRKVFRPDLEDPSPHDVNDALMALNLLAIPYVEPVDISNAVLFLASEEARYITGVPLPVDAGAAIK